MNSIDVKVRIKHLNNGTFTAEFPAIQGSRKLRKKSMTELEEAVQDYIHSLFYLLGMPKISAIKMKHLH